MFTLYSKTTLTFSSVGRLNNLHEASAELLYHHAFLDNRGHALSLALLRLGQQACTRRLHHLRRHKRERQPSRYSDIER